MRPARSMPIVDQVKSPPGDEPPVSVAAQSTPPHPAERARTFEESQKRVLAMYADTFRRLAE